MTVYIIVILFMLILRLLLQNEHDKIRYEKRENQYLWISAIVLVFLCMYRGETVGTDTPGYILNFTKTLPVMSFQKVLIRYNEFLGFYIPTWYMTRNGISTELWFGIIEFIYIAPIAILIQNYSKDKILSLLFFFCMGTYGFSLSGMKQTMAMGLVLWSFIFFRKKSYVIAALLFIWAYFCHKTSLVFSAFFLIYIFRKNKNFFFITTVVIVIFILYYQYIWDYMQSFIESDHYVTYNKEGREYSFSTFFFYLILLSISFFQNNSNKKRNKCEQGLTRVLFVSSAFCTIIQIFILISASAFRLSLYFIPLFTIYITNSVSGKNNLLYKYVISAFIIFFFIYTNRNGGSIIPYHFIWEGITVK